jgi:sulfatase maturation enzyme AslB (radical SAM superfamily)
MMTKPTLPFLETMITQACNLSCEGCTNYSDLTHQGYGSWAQGREWLSAWLERIHIPDFGIMGGEPLINPECEAWLRGVRELMPDAQIRFTTNGLLLERHWHLIKLMSELGNVSFKITVHKEDARVENAIQKIFDSYTWQPINEHGIDRWITTNNFRFHVKRPTRFVKTYRNSYANMAPWSCHPAAAFDNCVQQTCPLLYDGKIYKCSTAGLLKPVLERHGWPNKMQWTTFVPEGLDATCSDQDLDEFINNFGQPHSICGQCPDQHMHDSVLEHRVTVRHK